MKRFGITAAALVLLFALGPAANAQSKPYPTAKCFVGAVFDGDNISTLCKLGRTTKRWNLRLVGIDAPEARGHQPGWQESRDALRQLVLNHTVTVEVRGFETRWNRKLVRVFIANRDGLWVDAGLSQVQRGYAWYRAGYARTLSDADKASYEAAHNEAKVGKLGLWESSRPISPGDWRKGKR